jgi:hypothetical protein
MDVQFNPYQAPTTSLKKANKEPINQLNLPMDKISVIVAGREPGIKPGIYSLFLKGHACSRNHATLVFDPSDQTLKISDNQSSFGTTVSFKDKTDKKFVFWLNKDRRPATSDERQKFITFFKLTQFVYSQSGSMYPRDCRDSDLDLDLTYADVEKELSLDLKASWEIKFGNYCSSPLASTTLKNDGNTITMEDVNERTIILQHNFKKQSEPPPAPSLVRRVYNAALVKLGIKRD